jgi:opine dehydrogenase
MTKGPSFAILGAGNTGTSTAGILALSGFEVNLCELPSFEQNIKPIRDKGGIDVEGEFDVGYAKPNIITTSIKKAVEGVDVLLICCPAYGHEAFTRAFAPYLEDGQIIIYVSYFGALRMANFLSDINIEANVTVGETMGCIYACRRTGPTKVVVMRKKEELPVAAFPATKTDRVVEALNTFALTQHATNVLETSINNMNPWSHVSGVILNAARIEATKGRFSFYADGVTPAVKRLRTALDKEKMAIADALGFRQISREDWASKFYKKPLKGKYHSISTAPSDLNHRYLVEDIKYGIVPIASIGKTLGIETPNMNAVVRIASVLNEVDYWKEGVTARKLGLDGLNAEQMNKYAKEGKF